MPQKGDGKMKPCNDETCGSHHPGFPSNCKAGRVEDCGFYKPLTTDSDGGAEVALDCGVMAQGFMAECSFKFIRKAEENNRTLEPWKDEPTAYLCERLMEEFKELIDAADGGDPEAIMDECKDVANFVWFIYEQAKIKLATGP